MVVVRVVAVWLDSYAEMSILVPETSFKRPILTHASKSLSYSNVRRELREVFVLFPKKREMKTVLV